MNPKKILMLCSESQVPIIQESFQNSPEYNIDIVPVERAFKFGLNKFLRETINKLNKDQDTYDGIVGTRDPAAVLASVINESTGKPGISTESLIKCQNKYISRMFQKEISPESTPEFWLDEDFLKYRSNYPIFAKPCRANVSYASHKIYSDQELLNLIKHKANELPMLNQYYLDALSFTSNSLDELNQNTCNHFLCEEILTGTQLTVNGYVFQGDVQICGLVKSGFHEDRISFSHHEFPYQLSDELNQKLERVINNVVLGLGLNNTFFNIEVRVNEELQKVYVIEVNCRIAFQYAKTIESLTGYPLLHWISDIAAGDPPTKMVMKQNFKYCYNFELREFEDKYILRTPTEDNLREIKLLYPEVTIRNLVKPHTKLSDYKQNPSSYRYCIVNIPGNSQDDIMNKLHHIEARLGYEFKQEIETA